METNVPDWNLALNLGTLLAFLAYIFRRERRNYLKEENEDIRNRLTSIEKKNAECEKGRAQLEADVKTSVAEMKSGFAERDAQIAALQVHVRSLEGQIQGLESDKRNQRQAIGRLGRIVEKYAELTGITLTAEPMETVVDQEAHEALNEAFIPDLRAQVLAHIQRKGTIQADTIKANSIELTSAQNATQVQQDERGARQDERTVSQDERTARQDEREKGK